MTTKLQLVPPDEYKTLSKYDRLRGELDALATFTKPSTIQTVEQLTGTSETFIVETCRRKDLGGDYVFIQYIDENRQVTRLALPPKVANAIVSQRESLSTTIRRKHGKRIAAERMAEGWKPQPPKRRRKK